MQVIDQMFDMLASVNMMLIFVVLAIAGVQCFFGYKLVRIWIAFMGFISGGFVGAIIAGMSKFGGGGTAFSVLLFGALGAFIAYKVYLIGVFLMGFTNGTLIGLVLGATMGMRGSGMIGFGIVVGILAGVAIVILKKPIIILTTAIPAGLMFVGFFSGVMNPFFGVILGGGITVLGIWYQFTSNSKAVALVPVQGAVAGPGPGSTPVAPVTMNAINSNQQSQPVQINRDEQMEAAKVKAKVVMGEVKTFISELKLGEKLENLVVIVTAWGKKTAEKIKELGQ